MANSLITAGVDNRPSSTSQEQAMAEDKKPDRRVVMYRQGEAREFASPEDVPNGEGWVDHPDKAAPAEQAERPMSSIEKARAAKAKKRELQRQLEELGDVPDSEEQV